MEIKKEDYKSSLLLSSFLFSKSPAASLGPSTVTPLASDPAFLL